MLRLTSEKLQVLDSVVGRVFVDVMNYLFGQQMSSKMGLHHGAVEKDLAVIAAVDHPAAHSFIEEEATIPIVRLFASREFAAPPVMAVEKLGWFALEDAAF